MNVLNSYSIDEVNTARALRTGERRLGPASPNPAVGALIVAADGRVLGEGATSHDGGAHAEVLALREARAADGTVPADATLVVTLEPCSIHGRTPPCADAILDAGIRRVRVGALDFTPGVCGRGLERLRRGGCEVQLGASQDAARWLARRRETLTRLRRPYVILKQAVSADGFVGRAARRVAVTRAPANVVSHAWRARADAILVGWRTVAADDPTLTARLAGGASPLRVVVDPHARLDGHRQRLFRDGGATWWVTNTPAASQPLPKGVRHCSAPAEQPLLAGLLSELAAARISSLLVEGGPATLGAFLAANLYDELRVWRSPRPLSGDQADAAIPATAVPTDSRFLREVAVGEDLLRVYRAPARCC